MNKLLLNFMAFATIMLVVSCADRDGVIETKMQIDNVLAEEQHFNNDAIFYSRDTYTDEDWHWDDDKLYRIDYLSDHPYSENFFYGSHNRLESTTVPAYDIRTQFYYDGKKLERIEFLRDDQLYMTMFFLQGEEKINSIECRYYNTDTNKVTACCNPLTTLIGNDIAAKLEAANVARMEKQRNKGVKTLTTRYEFTWSGDNVSSIRCIDSEGSRNITLTYDNEINPYSQLFGYRELSDPIFGFEMLSKNNVVTIQMPYLHNDNQLFTYTYKYDGKYPISRTLTYSYQTVNSTTFDSVMYKYVKTQTFNYL